MDQFSKALSELLSLPEETATKLAELLEDRVKEIVEDRLDFEHSRGDYARVI